MKRAVSKDRRVSLADLERVLREAGLELKSKPVRPEPPPRPTPEREGPEEVLFEREMEGVSRPRWRNVRVGSARPSATPQWRSGSEDLTLMRAALEGKPAPAADDHPEYIEGWVDLRGRQYLNSLRNGIYSIQGQLDLHGLDQNEARNRVEEYIRRMSRYRSCCVKIIHGRGINSTGDRPVLKESLQGWLTTRRMSRHVLAYASAPPRDGGVGAVYVLLRHAVLTPVKRE